MIALMFSLVRKEVFFLFLAVIAPLQTAWSMDLLQVWVRAKESDATYKGSLLGSEASKEALPQARAQLLPNLSFSGTLNQVNLEKSERGVSSSPMDYQSTNSTLTLRQTLYRKSQFAQYFQSKEQIKASEAEEKRAELELLSRSTGIYFEVLFSFDVLNYIEKLYEATAGQWRAAQLLYTNGQGTRTDVDEAKARLDQVSAQQLQAKQQLNYNLYQLETVLSAPVDFLAALDMKRAVFKAPDKEYQHYHDLALQLHPDLLLAQAKVEIAKLEVDKAKAGHYPTLDWVAQRSKSKSENVLTPLATYLTTQTGVQLSVPIFSGGYTDSAVNQTQILLTREQENFEQTKRNVSLMVRKEFQNLNEGVLKIIAYENALASAQQMVTSTRKSIIAGVRTQTELLNALQREAETQRDLAQARYQFLISLIKLLTMSGTPAQDAVARVNQFLSLTPK